MSKNVSLYLKRKEKERARERETRREKKDFIIYLTSDLYSNVESKDGILGRSILFKYFEII